MGWLKQRARIAFTRAWSYDFFWNTLIGAAEFGPWTTNMGHAVYAAGGADYDDNIRCPFSDPEEVLNFDPWERFGRRDKAELVERFEDNYRHSCQTHPFGVNMTGVYVTLISAFTAIFGWEMQLLAAGADLKRFGELADRYASWIQQYFDALSESDVPLVLVHDDMVWTSGAIYPPEWYQKHVFPNYKKYFAPVIESGKKLLFCSDGGFTEFVDDIAAAGAQGFIFEPMTSLEYIAGRYGKTHVIVGNADTRILLSGPREKIRAEVERCIGIGRNCPGFFMAVGNHIPPNTPVENALYYNEVYDEIGHR